MPEFNQSLLESGIDIVPDAISQDANSDIDGDWISLKDYDRAYYLLLKPAGTAGDDLSIRLQQALTAAGGSAKALTFKRLWHKIGTPSGVGRWTKVDLATPTDDLDLVSVNSVDLATDTSAAAILVEVAANSLDINNGFGFVQALIEGDDISNALIISTMWILQGGRFPQGIPLSPLA